MAFNNWFVRTTSGKNTWTTREATSTEATINGTAELPPFALLAQASWGFTATASLSVQRNLAAAAFVSWTATASLRVTSQTVPPPQPPRALVMPLPEAIVPSSTDWQLITNTVMNVSPLTGKTQTINHGGERWAVTLQYRNLQRGPAGALMAMLSALRGQYGRVTLPDHAYQRRGALAVDLAVVGSAQTGSTLTCDGGTPSITNAVRAGDLFTLEERLYMVTEDADTNVSGNVTLTFTPPLQEPPTDNATVSLVSPTAKFMLANNSVSWSYSPAGFTSFNAVELVEDRT